MNFLKKKRRTLLTNGIRKKRSKVVFFYKCICTYFECSSKLLARFLSFSSAWLAIIFKITELTIPVSRIKHAIAISFFAYLSLNNDFFALKDEMSHRSIIR